MIDASHQNSGERAPHIRFVHLPFDSYLEAMISHQPGFLSDLYERFCGPVEAPISFTGRYEHLADDLVSALLRAGETFDEDALRSVAPVNASAPCPPYRAEVATQLLKAEEECMERFYP